MEKKKYHIVSFSGGKDSTAMLLRMIEEGMPIDEIVCCDTTVEFPAMYEHIKEVEAYIGRPITILRAEYDFEHYMLKHIKTRGKNKGKAGMGWPDFRVRWCTGQLKRDVIKKHLTKYKKDYEIVEYHGIAIDERERTEKNNDGRNIKYPLIDWEMTEEQCLQYCYDRGFNWNGLYKHFSRLSCYLCPLARIGELKVIYEQFPELWQHMKELDIQSIEITGRKFRGDYTMQELDNRFKNERKPLFKIGKDVQK